MAASPTASTGSKAALLGLHRQPFAVLEQALAQVLQLVVSALVTAALALQTLARVSVVEW